ncbi:MAG: MMPL family transporter, partial [Verrucomicrobia bacterium]|nr:MMPL family transporter [Verrucomicrobiota bacterium]
MRSRAARWGWVATGGLLLLIYVVAGLSRISFNVDILKLLPTHLRQVEGLSLLLKHFAQSNELIVTLEASTAETAEAEADAIAAALAQQPRLVKRAVARPPWEKNPGELAELLAYLVLNQPPEEIRALAARLAPAQAPATLQATLDLLTESVSPQEIALRGYDPFDLTGSLAGLGLLTGAQQQQQQSEFASADGTFRVIYVEAAKPFGNYKETIAWMKEIQRVLAPWRDRPGLRLGYTGDPAFAASIAGSMEWDMASSGVITLGVIALIFWLCYRRARPLLDLQLMLLLIFALTLATAGLFLRQLTVIGVGCAAIMIGLSVDYGYFVFQRSQLHGGTVRELQKQCLQYIAWTAGTTAAAFFALNLSSLPGLSQLGTLVGMGVLIGAVVMLVVYAPLTRRFQRRAAPRPPSVVECLVASTNFQRTGAWLTLAVVLVLLGALAVKGLPQTDFTDRPLRPRHSEAYAALERMEERLTDEHGLRSLVVRGGSVEETVARLRAAESRLAAAQARGDVVRYRSALPLWPDVAHQRANLPVLAPLAAEIPRLRQALRDAGFQDEAFALTESVLTQWSAWSAHALPVWPDNAASRWIFRRAVSRTADGQWLALGLVKPAAGREQALDDAVKNLDGV